MTDIFLIDDQAWQEAARRAEVIRPLATRERCPRHLARDAAKQLGLSERQVYALVQRFRRRDGATEALMPGISSGGRGGARIGKAQEDLLWDLIHRVYLSPQRLSAEAFIREVQQRCQSSGLPSPSASTIRRRLKRLSAEERSKRGKDNAQLASAAGKTPIPCYPLDAVQIDHTKVDVILVDPIDRQPIGRPWLTVAIDVHSRCIAGMHLSLEAPSAISVGLCLLHLVSEKASWLTERGINAEWPVAGKPRLVSVDNGTEFHSAAFERGCEQHGIAITWRPPGQPHFGGIVERVLGTLMKLVHELPGTTFSNPGERGRYDSNSTASMTLEELEHWLAVAITRYYHHRPHGGLLGESPLSRYQSGMRKLTADGERPLLVKNMRRFLIDFLPVARRTLRRDGITLDHVTYYSHALRPWIGRRDTLGPLLIRRDPRDISRIYVHDPAVSGYLEIPYRDLARPTISLWEHRLALRRLREQRRKEIDETALFAAVAEMRAIERTATAATRSARRNRTRRQSMKPTLGENAMDEPRLPPPSGGTASETGVPRPFDEIEEW